MSNAKDLIADLAARGGRATRAAAAVQVDGSSGPEALSDRRRNAWIAELWRPYESYGIRSAIVFAASRLAELEAREESAKEGERIALERAEAAEERCRAAEERLRITTEEMDP